MIARAVLAAVAVVGFLVGCGPTTRGPTPPAAADVHRPALVAVVPDAATLDSLIAVLAPVGGDRLGVLRFGVEGRIAPWPTAELAAHGVRADAPIGLAVTADGVVIRWAAVADARALAAAFDGTEGGARWKTEGADLWRFGDDAIAVVVKDRVAAFSGGAGSKREQAALQLASGELEVTAAPRTGGIAIDVDGELLVAGAMTEPGPVVRRIGADLGRVRFEVTAANAVVGFDVDVTPAAGSLAAELVAGATGAQILVPDAPIGFSTKISPAHASALVAEIAATRKIDVPALLQTLGRTPDKVFNGELAFAPGAATVKFVDLDTMALAQRLVEQLVEDRDVEHGLLALGGPGAHGGIGVVISPQRIAPVPDVVPDKRELPPLDDENTDVPWSQDYRDARTAFETALAKYRAAVTARTAAIKSAWYEWDKDFGPLVSIELAPVAGKAGAFHGHGEWHPGEGTIAATVAAGAAEYAKLSGHDADVDATYAAAVAAHDKALKVRAKDVQAWDNKKH